MYFKLVHMFMPILTDVFNHWFAHLTLPGHITFLKRNVWHFLKGLYDFRYITLFSTELKVLDSILKKRLWIITDDLIRTEQNYFVKAWLTQNNLHWNLSDLWGIRKRLRSRTDKFKSFQCIWYCGLHRLPRSSDFSRPRKVLLEEIASDPLNEQLGLSLEEICFQSLASSHINISDFSLTWHLA